MFTIHIYFNFVLHDTSDSVQAYIDVSQAYQLQSFTELAEFSKIACIKEA